MPMRDSNPDIQKVALLWSRTLARVKDELRRLPQTERTWIEERLLSVGRLQEALHALFLRAQGPLRCAECLGACCDRGKNHLTLVTLLAYLLAGEEPPELRFDRPCPPLGETGCLLPPSRRPFNCVTFICEIVEKGLSQDERTQFYALERQLRTIYEEFDGHFSGSSLRGLLIRAERLGERPYLERI
jgi:hypothetical protein